VVTTVTKRTWARRSRSGEQVEGAHDAVEAARGGGDGVVELGGAGVERDVEREGGVAQGLEQRVEEGGGG
jgi:hypothetical protein